MAPPPEEVLARLLCRSAGVEEDAVSAHTGRPAWHVHLPAAKAFIRQHCQPGALTPEPGVVVPQEVFTLALSLARTAASRAPTRGKNANDPFYAAARKLSAMMESLPTPEG